MLAVPACSCPTFHEVSDNVGNDLQCEWEPLAGLESVMQI